MEKVKNIILAILAADGIEGVAIEQNSSLRDLGLDSLKLAQLTVEIEDVYDVDIFEDGIVETVQDILDKLKVDESA